MANERSLAVGVSFLGYGDPGDGVPASIYTQCPICLLYTSPSPRD